MLVLFLDPASERSPAHGRPCSASPRNAVTVNVRRMGGGFGGKETQANLFACVAALAAKKAQARR
jgi:xanthine dehydrogenase molybdopterin-binding subunit B